MAKKMKGNTLLKRKITGLEKEKTVHPRMNQIVIEIEIDSSEEPHIDNGLS